MIIKKPIWILKKFSAISVGFLVLTAATGCAPSASLPAMGSAATTNPELVRFVRLPAAESRSALADFEFYAVSSADSGAFECSIDGAAFSACATTQSYSALGDGTHVFAARVVGTTRMATATWKVDTGLPVTVISTPPTANSNEAVASFAFSASDQGTIARYECAVDGGSFSICSPPQIYVGLTDGGHTFSVRAVDAAGNVGVAVSRTWAVDFDRPVVSILTAPALITSANSAAFTFSGSDTGSSMMARFECRLDDEAYATCASPQNYSAITEGAHRFSLRAADAAGNISPEITHRWQVDITPPSVTIVSGPSSATAANSATFILSAADAVSGASASFRCALDGAAFSACATPAVFTGLAEGSHTLAVKAVDGAGNTSAPVSQSWNVILSAPLVSITAKPASLNSSASHSLAFSGSSPSGAAIASYRCAMDGGAEITCASPQAFSGLAGGSHTFTVKAIDAAGNASAPASATWVTDLVAPSVVINTAPASVTSIATASFSFVGSDAGGGAIREYECALDGASFSTCASPKAYSGLTELAHTFQVRAIDTAGNVGAPVVHAWAVQTGSSIVTISSAPARRVNSTAPSFSFSGSAPSGRTIVSYSCSVDGAAFAACSSPFSRTGIAEGDHTFKARFVDDLGAFSAEATQVWTVDLTAPTATISIAPAALNRSPAAVVAFGGTDPNGGMVVDYTCSVDGGAYAACTSPVSLTSLSDGNHSLAVKARDSAGNTGTAASTTWKIDSAAPAIAITSAPAAQTQAVTAGIVFSATDASTVSFSCSLDGAAAAACTSPVNLSGLSLGAHQFSITGTDLAGNRSFATHQWAITGAVSFALSTSTASPVAGTAFNLTVKAVDSSGTLNSGFAGPITLSSTDAAFVPPGGLTLTGGQATFSVTLKTSGAQFITAQESSASLRGSTAALAVSPGVCTNLKVEAPSLTASVNQNFSVSIRALDAFGNVATACNMDATITSTDASLAAVTLPISAGTGGGFVKFKTSGTHTLTAAGTSNPGVNGSLTGITVGAGTASRLELSRGDLQNSAVGTAFAVPLEVIVKDAEGNIVSGATVAWSVTSGAATLSAASSASSATGKAMITANPTSAAQLAIRASINGGATTLTFNETVTSAPATQIAISAGNGQNVSVGTASAASLTAIVRNASNAPVANAPVEWAVTSGSGSVSSVLTFTDAAGLASVSTTAGNTVGAQTISAREKTSGASVVFTINKVAGAVARLDLTGPATIVAGTPTNYTVTAVDAFGNRVSSYRGYVRYTTAQMTDVLPANYLFAAADAGAHSAPVNLRISGMRLVTVTDLQNTSLTGSMNISIEPGTPSGLAVQLQPIGAFGANSGVVWPQQPQILVVDAGGNRVTSFNGPVTVSINAGIGKGVLNGTTTINAVNGLATFTNLSITVTDSTYVGKFGLKLASGALPPNTSFQYNVANAPTGPAGTTYYVSPTGSDTNNGTSAATPWQTIAKANASVYQAGDSLLFEGGQSFTGCLRFKTTNVLTTKNSAVFKVGSYGTGRFTLNANCTGSNPNYASAIETNGVSSITIQDCILRGNTGGAQYGVWIHNFTSQSSYNTTVKNCDIGGFYNTALGDYGAEISVMGDNKGILIDGVKILNNQLHGLNGPSSLDDNGVSGWSSGGNITNYLVQGNAIYNIGGKPNGPPGCEGNGVVANGITDGLIQFNVAHDMGGNVNTCGGSAGFWFVESERGIIQYNESYNVKPLTYTTGCDWDGFDLDIGVEDSYLQYNYSHDNFGGGYLGYAKGAWDRNTMRYNLSINDGKSMGSISINAGAVGSHFNIYNNLIYSNYATGNGSTAFTVVSGTSAGEALIVNNIFQIAPNASGYSNMTNSSGFYPSGWAFLNNNYYGATAANKFVFNWLRLTYNTIADWLQFAGGDPSPISVNPAIINPPATAPICVADSAAATMNDMTLANCLKNYYRLNTGSPMMGAAIDLRSPPFNIDIGPRDFFGNATKPAGTPGNIGPYEGN